VLDEYVSRESAERDYGVVMTGEVDDYSLEVDQAATKKLRAGMRRKRRPAGNGSVAR
jgi:N-methylhydantoinase B